jgi:hypothetical protein
MRVAELADDRRIARPRPRAGLHEARSAEPQNSRIEACRPALHSTGFEPFLIAALLGLCLWGLILTPIFL